MKPLIIVESPAKCKKIEGFLDNKFSCVASFGHIRELKDGLKCIDIDNHFKPKFSLSNNKNLSKLKTSIKNSKEVYLATDDDREGEAIAWHICQVFKLPIATTKRIIFHEITKTAITRAIQNPTIVNMNKVNAQLSRVVLDRLVGFKISPVLWKNINRKSGLSAGRCQTPALRLIYDNQKEIDASPGKFAYDTTGYFTQHNLPFKLNKTYDTEEKIVEFLEESVNHKHIFKRNKPRQTSKEPPKPFTTSTLQQAASNLLHFSPKQTMMFAQKLYEGGLITYMRTDSKTYSKEFVENTKKYIIRKYEPGYVNKNIDTLCVRKKTNNAQEAHESIRPTKIETIQCPDKFDVKERKLYMLIWKNTIQSCMNNAVYNVLDCSVEAPFDNLYKYSVEQIVFPGWKIVDDYTKENEQNTIIYNFLQLISNKTIRYKKIKSVQNLKDLKQHYSEARLVQLLEKRGIGRPSTFSSLISKIQERNYVKKENVEGKTLKCTDYELVDDTLEEIENSRVFGNEKNKLVLQDLGKIVLEFLTNHYDNLFNYDYTRTMEEQLDVISNGDLVWYKLCETCLKDIDKIKIDNTNTTHITIDNNHTYVIGKYGPCIKYTNGEKTSFKKIKKGIDVDKLKQGKYTLEDLIDNENNIENNSLGVYKDEDVILKTGKFGPYVVYKNKSYSVKSVKNVTLQNVIPILTGEKSTNPSVIKILNKELSIRKGKYGPYIYYKTDSMTKPAFYGLKGCKLDPYVSSSENYLEWISENHGL